MCTKYRHVDKKLVIKVTDNHKVIDNNFILSLGVEICY